jgi:hypothetical protein
LPDVQSCSTKSSLRVETVPLQTKVELLPKYIILIKDICVYL